MGEPKRPWRKRMEGVWPEFDAIFGAFLLANGGWQGLQAEAWSTLMRKIQKRTPWQFHQWARFGVN